MKQLLIAIFLLISFASFSQSGKSLNDSRTVTRCGSVWTRDQAEETMMLTACPLQDEEVTAMSVYASATGGYCYSVTYTCTGISVIDESKKASLLEMKYDTGIACLDKVILKTVAPVK